jgi:hypothetical protein
MSNTNNALSQLTDNPVWNWSNYGDLDLVKTGTLKKFDPNKYKAFFPDYSQTTTTPPTGSDPAQLAPTASTSPVNEDADEARYRRQAQVWADMLPTQIGAADMIAKAQADRSYEQMVRSYPLLSQAAYETTQRNLAASKNFLMAKEATPTAGQARRSSAAASAAQLDYAMADKQRAAKEFAGRFAGSTFQVG